MVTSTSSARARARSYSSLALQTNPTDPVDTLNSSIDTRYQIEPLIWITTTMYHEVSRVARECMYVRTRVRSKVTADCIKI